MLFKLNFTLLCSALLPFTYCNDTPEILWEKAIQLDITHPIEAYMIFMDLAEITSEEDTQITQAIFFNSAVLCLLISNEEQLDEEQEEENVPDTHRRDKKRDFWLRRSSIKLASLNMTQESWETHTLKADVFCRRGLYKDAYQCLWNAFKKLPVKDNQSHADVSYNLAFLAFKSLEPREIIHQHLVYSICKSEKHPLHPVRAKRYKRGIENFDELRWITIYRELHLRPYPHTVEIGVI